MDRSIKKLVKNINLGKDLNNNLPVYLEKLENAYYKNACIHSVLEYYTLYEIVSEKENKSLNEISEVAVVLQNAVEALFADGSNQTGILEKLEKSRDEVIKKMDVLTAYVDIIQIYEYVLNRLEYRYKEYTMPNEEMFVNKVIQYIFQVKDNQVINENIKEIVGQLPVRMVKSKFFELLKKSVLLYSGSDKASVETYLYMLRTSSMLYKPEGLEQYFPEFAKLIEELKEADYKELSKEQFDELYNKIEKASEQLFELTDLFVMVQSILNSFCVLSLCEGEHKKEESVAVNLLLQINKGMKDDTVVLSELEQDLVSLEGMQEELSQEILTLESILFDVCHYREQEVRLCGLEKKANAVWRMEKLLSSSLFIDLEGQEDNQPLESKYLEEVAEEFIEDLVLLFKHNSMEVNRAVMASVLNKMPVFFESSEEVMEYVKNAFEACRDREEKMAVIEILETIMTE